MVKLVKTKKGKPFSERVVAAALSIPKGRVTTYGRIARACGGGAMASQSITGILARAFVSGVQGIPFHRIVYADGTVWLDESTKEKRHLLYKEEGIELDIHNKIKSFKDIVFDFS